jgi:Spy/CpxP family protein refolding chaperone
MMAQASLKAGLAALLMLSCAPAALAQPYDAPQYPAPDYGQQQQDLQRSQQEQQQQSEDQQDEQQQQEDQYRDARQRYEEQQQRYQQQRDVYEGARAKYDADRAAYDAEYGAGAWQRYYLDHQDAYDARYGEGAWERDFGASADSAYGPGYYAPNAYYDGAPSAYSASPSCENRRNGAGLVGGVIGAIAGGAIGSSVARGADRGAGTAIGAVLGGAVGVGVGRSAADCDENGYYFSYNQTYPYREGEWEQGRSGRYDHDWYESHRCRLAVAPATYNGVTEDRYVRVCPDADGRYRITG